MRVLHVTGELDVQVAPGLLRDVPDLVSGAVAVVLDLTRVTFLDSSGLRLVDRLARSCAAVGTAFRVAAPPESPSRRVLDLVGFSEPLASDDLDAAVKAVGAA